MAKKKIPQIVKEVRNKIKRDIDWGNEKLVSYFQFSMFNEYPKKWSLQYKEGHKQFTSNIHTVFGSAIHLVVQTYLDIMYQQSNSKADSLDLDILFEEELRKEYMVQYKKNENKHFLEPGDLQEAYEDGLEIIDYLKKNKSKYFSKRGWHLIGCEIPITLNPDPKLNNVVYQGYLDVVLYNENTNRIKIIDIKGSMAGWKDSHKKDENKQFQLILYKKFFSEYFDFPIDNIDIEFLILKRKVYESEDFYIKRFQTFIPPSGKIKLKKAITVFDNFIESAFDKNGYKQVDHQPIENKNCEWCSFYKTYLCKATHES